MQSFSSPALLVVLPCNPDLLRQILPSLLATSHFSMTTTSFAPLLHRAFTKALSVPKPTISIKDSMMT